jgi:hypothetical protein
MTLFSTDLPTTTASPDPVGAIPRGRPVLKPTILALSQNKVKNMQDLIFL